MTSVVNTTAETTLNDRTLSGMALQTTGASACSMPINTNDATTPRENA